MFYPKRTKEILSKQSKCYMVSNWDATAECGVLIVRTMGHAVNAVNTLWDQKQTVYRGSDFLFCVF